jgi:hypothetical protein
MGIKGKLLSHRKNLGALFPIKEIQSSQQPALMHFLQAVFLFVEEALLKIL